MNWPEQAALDGVPPGRYPSLITEKDATNNGPKDRPLDRPEKLSERLAVPLHKGKEYSDEGPSML